MSGEDQRSWEFLMFDLDWIMRAGGPFLAGKLILCQQRDEKVFDLVDRAGCKKLK